jgi:Flp pilus assembly protein TadG
MFLMDRLYSEKRSKVSKRRGSSMVEFALLMPWYAFLFVGAFDYGFYAYGLIATQNAARVAAMYCSASASRASNCDATYAACNYALDQLRNLPNVGSSMTGPCSAPVVVTTTMLTAATTPSSPDGGNAAQVTGTYTTRQLIPIPGPIPGLLPGVLTISRTATTATMRVLT